MTQRTVTAVYRADVDRFISDTARAGKSVTGFAKDTANASKKSIGALDDVGTKAALVGAGLGAVFVGAVGTFAQFDKSMSGVSAALDDGTRSASQLASEKERLAEAALAAGEASVFSASEAAQAEGELARAGLKTADIIGGALKGSLDLAAAGQVGLAESAELTAQTLTIFELAGDQASRVADTLTAGANKSAAGVDDLGMALKQGGGVAAQWGLTLEDTIGTLSLFADNALKGSDAGTSLRTMLGRLNPTTKEAASMMEELGLNFYDAEGNFIGITAAAEQLNQKIAPLPQNLRDTAVQTIFGADAQRSANILIDEGAAGLQKYIQGVTDKGAAERMAARQTDNLIGDLEQLKGALETTFIRGGAGSNQGLRDLVQMVTDAVRWFNSLPPAVQENTVKLIGLSAAAALVAAGAIKATTSILALKASMDAANISGARLSTTLKTIGKGGLVATIAGISVSISQLQGEARVGSVEVDSLADSLDGLASGSRYLEGGLADLFRDWDPGFARSREEVVTLTEAVERFQALANAGLPQGFWADVERGFNGTNDEAAQFEKTITQLDTALAQLVRNGGADVAAASLARLTEGMSKADAAAVSARLTEYQASLDETAMSAPVAAQAQIGLSDNLQMVEDSASAAGDELDKYIQGLVDAGLVVLSTRSAQRNLAESIHEAAKAAREATKAGLSQKQMFDINTEAGRKNQAALDGVANDALALAQAIYEETGSEDAFRASLVKSRGSLIATGTRFGMTKAQAEAFADSVLNIPPAKRVDITTTANTARNGVVSLKREIAGLNGKTITITTRMVTQYHSSGGGRNTAGGTTAFAGGGYIRGPGTTTSDSIPILASDKEYMTKAAAVAHWGVDLFDELNSMQLSAKSLRRLGVAGFAGGGHVLAAARPGSYAARPAPTAFMPTPSQQITETTHQPVVIEKFYGTIADAEWEANQRRKLTTGLGGRRTRT